MIMNSQI